MQAKAGLQVLDELVRPVQGRSDRFGDRSDRSETPNPSQELYFNTRFVRILTPNKYRPSHPIYSYLTFYPQTLLFIVKPYLFQPHLLFFACLYGVRECSEWPADLRTTLDP